MRRAWTRGDLVAAGAAAVGLAASAEAAWTLRARFALDLEGLSALERAGVALWDFRPLATALFAAAAVAFLVARDEPGPAGGPLALLAGAHAALGLVVTAAAAWIAAAGSVGRRGELGFAYPAGERAVALVTQLAAWLPLTVVLAGVALAAARRPSDTVLLGQGPESEPAAAAASVADEMEALWRERVAFGPRRERGRELLRAIRAAEDAGDGESARRLAAELRRLAER